ncbi:glycosyltransferase family 1 protein [Pedobacter sp. AJM]|uniref:glycosyltransferase family 1 protein n=1 Tax=Pedobacter sp. AJM TaxID=2003629 RepID=UPI000B4A55F7|nr:glycosyltransferase family 1 protein [Pedobacter sp. AJM]OWK71247.1 hypothetical protein CBW18_09290 [Pedobacter sp. AJM]
MSIKPRVIIILDSLKYLVKEDKLKQIISQDCNPEFYYTYYENSIVKFFHGLPIIGNFLSHLAYWSISLKEALRLIVFKKKYNIKIFINPIVAIFYCGITRLVLRKEDISVAGFLFEDKSNKLYLNLRKSFVNFCYKKVKNIIVYSNNEVLLYSEFFPALAGKFVFIRYGRDFDIFEENEYTDSERYISSGGVSNRDFATLFKAFNILSNSNPQLKCKIATRPQAIDGFSEAKNIIPLYNIRIDTFGSFLDKSIFVIIPLADTFISAGHMALLESMYRKKVILITDIPAVKDYVDESVAFFYKANDEYNLAKMIEYINLNIDQPEIQLKADAAFQRYSLDFDFSSLLKRIVTHAVNKGNFSN